MQFLGLNSFIRDKDSFIDTYVSTSKEITNIKLSGGYLFNLYASSDSSIEQYDEGMPTKWVYDETSGNKISITTMSATFDNSCNASPFEIDVQAIDCIRIKKRLKNSNQDWQTLYEQPITVETDFSLNFTDYLCKNNCDYQYNIVPVKNGVETYIDNTIDVHSSFGGVWFTNGQEQYGTPFDVKSDYARKTSSTTAQPINSRYPVSIKNGYLNYSSGNVSGRLLKVDENCNINLDGNFEYRKNAVDFLSENETLVFKNHDGFMAIISVGDEISESFDDIILAPKVSLSWTQIGDADDYDELKNNGLIGGEIE